MGGISPAAGTVVVAGTSPGKLGGNGEIGVGEEPTTLIMKLIVIYFLDHCIEGVLNLILLPGK